ncbi:35994_t:CDS:2, partial [Racocetra persica]
MPFDQKKYINHEKHFQRGTLTDIRGQPKKSGAGNGNWGVLGDEINV